MGGVGFGKVRVREGRRRERGEIGKATLNRLATFLWAVRSATLSSREGEDGRGSGGDRRSEHLYLFGV